MIPLPLGLKVLVPGYRDRWRNQYAAMIDHIIEVVPKLRFGDDDGVPWIEERDGGVRLYGFWTEKKNLDVLRLLGDVLPSALPAPWFRLVKDYINRYLYPHMRPDLKPIGYPVARMFGFHGQHKDAIADLAPAVQPELTAAFVPEPDDVILDCGCFLGFGEVRMAPDIPRGHMYAVEASAECFAVLKRNLAVNAIRNVTSVHRAVWDDERDMDLESDFAQANSLVREVKKGVRTQRVRTITIDRLVDLEGLHKLDMVNLTLNGAEPEALMGAQKTLAEFRPRIRLAGWYERSGRKIWEITKEILEERGYRVFVGQRGNVLAIPR